MTVIDHRVDPVSRSVLTRHQASPRGGTIGGTGVRLFKNQAFLGKRIDIWGWRQIAACKTDIFPPHVIDEDENEIRSIRGVEAKWNDKEN
jgi:hypothetical protein